MLHAITDTMQGGDFLEPEQILQSADGGYKLKYQNDGNLVVYRGTEATWSSGTCGQPAWRACMQDDGNLVVYASEGSAIWSSDTCGNNRSRLVMQNDGNLVIYNIANNPIWDSIGNTTEGSYDTQFTRENQSLLGELNLLNATLEKTNEPIESVNIEWGQVSRALLGNEEPYKECVYQKQGSTALVKVFVAESCGEPPQTFNASGVNYNGGRLHFGYVEDDDEKVKAVFFVIHPADRKPFQKRFRTNLMYDLLHAGAEMGFARASSAVVGAAVGSIVPVVGTAAGAVVGYCAGEISTAAFDSLCGDYLRYVG
ncbi:hypothetical protein ACFL2V_03920 [Pseudomonadota bacterium]